jgi:cytochrome c553
MSMAMTTKLIATLCAGLATMAVFGTALAADIEAGRAKAEVCAACHGKDGNTPIDPSYPRLAGQHSDYLLAALTDYKNERRKNPIMAAQAKMLSGNDMKNLAAYYESLPGHLTNKR